MLIGRLTKDPQIRYTSNNMAVASFTLAIDRPAKKGEDRQADFPRVIVFGKQAESCERYLFKGMLTAVSGRIQTGKYQNQKGDTVYTTDVVANRVEFLEWKKRQQPAGRAVQPSERLSASTELQSGSAGLLQLDLPESASAEAGRRRTAADHAGAAIGFGSDPVSSRRWMRTFPF
jgi:single-strand DNA-binding protein